MKVELDKSELALFVKHVQSEIRKCAENIETAKRCSQDNSNSARLGWKAKIPQFKSELKMLIELENKLSS